MEPASEARPKRQRTKTLVYQSPIPKRTKAKKPAAAHKIDDDVIFHKHEFLAVRNDQDGFYVCQAMQNVYKHTSRLRIRWLSQDPKDTEIYFLDYYDYTEFDCILTNLNLNKVQSFRYQLTKYELLRTENILKRSLSNEKLSQNAVIC